MTRERVRAQQAQSSGSSTTLVPVTVTAVHTNTVTVQLPGGATLDAPRIAGCTYTVGNTAFALLQPPGVFPVIPVGPEVFPPVPTSTYGTIDFTGTTCTDQGGTELGRFGDLVTVNAYINVGSAGAAPGTLIGRLPTGYRPRNARAGVWAIWSSTGWKGTADVEIGSDGTTVLKWVSTTVNASDGIFGNLTFAGA